MVLHRDGIRLLAVGKDVDVIGAGLPGLRVRDRGMALEQVAVAVLRPARLVLPAGNADNANDGRIEN